MDDLVRRKDVIDALHGLAHRFEDPEDWRILEGEAEFVVSKLPSAQPEIIRCHSCKHWTRTIGEMRGFGLGICDFHNAEYVTCNGFCHWAERRELNG